MTVIKQKNHLDLLYGRIRCVSIRIKYYPLHLQVPQYVGPAVPLLYEECGVIVNILVAVFLLSCFPVLIIGRYILRLPKYDPQAFRR